MVSISKSLFTLLPKKIKLNLNPTMSWSCSSCTFLNPPSQKSSCQICLSDSPLSISLDPSISVPKPKWPCKACTFMNPYHSISCEICGNRVSASGLATLETEDDDDDLSSSVGNVFLPLRPCNKGKVINRAPIMVQDDVKDSVRARCANAANKRKNREEPSGVEDDEVDAAMGYRGVKVAATKAIEQSDSVEQELGKTFSTSKSKVLKILTYNVWFADIEMNKRMKAIGNLISLHKPDVICFQEVTPEIYDIFQHSGWWKMYSCSISNVMELTRGYFCMQLSKLAVKSYSCKPFSNSIMGRELCIAEIEVEKDTTLVVATSHLESPCPGPPKWDQMYSKERVQQAKEAVELLERKRNVVFCGDMNWDDKLDGQFPPTDGWIDAWGKMKPEEIGWTYDTKSNKMLSANRTLQKRLDRIACKLQDFCITDVKMIGKDAIPNLTYIKEKKVKSEVKKLTLPVLPSDHYGLLLEISPQ
ncbi:uncharacterized protein LOC107009074 [Solanum pennellii]|uniref:Uncharacterized protein LOC107009074 n=1 Tax=Solanum pennellii TaxID=28526 RepID=A0ABM1FZJ2_SOLPN|nr:uncharacterized protein LOC107009074 [Solanum pennellii]